MEKTVNEQIKAILPGVEEKKILATLTTYKIGGPADYFFEAETTESLVKAAAAAKFLGLPLLVIGGGSNILISDEGFRGLVVKTKNQEIKFSQDGAITAGAGVRLRDLADFFYDNSLKGMEWAAGIPGTVGGAVKGNAGSAPGSICDIVRRVYFFDIDARDPVIRSYSAQECGFSYRESIFKKNGSLIIVYCEITGEPGKAEDIKKEMDEFFARKKESQPLEYPSAGSVFKNPKDMFAAKLIDECGLKGRTIGKAMISKKHANFIINTGGASASDVKALIMLAKSEVKKKFNLELEEEIKII
ncbi:MAG TPA: UDP-N-acetylmuramate dehydrogenase [Candidatus Paceibacterota bacterium]|nr:UDP-N-acetylmuramate dehydrogenase [Candidatus Pacearchaeota archaeon]HRZ50663.1 UDP-N-acetylmuramate dehydrogenase [Candidatus Paceibacterota bacterium]HSA36440.1 UDP-N-acetylmuramate dehydrogenase [Candidatus Paceibacterota bacterium]